MADKVNGPASYFPSIERNYGRPINEWKSLIRGSGITGHKDLVAWLKTEHGFGHGHANALVAHTLQEGEPRPDADAALDALFPPAKAHWRPVYEALAAAAADFGEDVSVVVKKTAVGLKGSKAQFAILQPSTADRFDVGFKLKAVEANSRLEPAGSWNTMMTYRVRLAAPEELDQQVLNWLLAAYRQSG